MIVHVEESPQLPGRAHPRGPLTSPAADSPEARQRARCSHAPCSGAWVRNTVASLGSALCCTTKTPFGFLRLCRRTAAHHQLHCFSPCLVETHHMSPSFGKRWQCGHTYDNVTPPCPWTGATIRLMECGTTLFSLYHSCSFTLVQRIELVTLSTAPTSRPLRQPSSLFEPLCLPGADCPFPAAQPIPV